MKEEKNGDDDEAKELRPREWNPVLFAFTSCMRPFHTISLVHASNSRCKDDTTVHSSHILSPAKLPMSWCGLWQHKETMKHHLQQQKYPPHEFCSGETWVKWVNTVCVCVCLYASLSLCAAGTGSTFHAIFILFTPFLFTRQSPYHILCVSAFCSNFRLCTRFHISNAIRCAHFVLFFDWANRTVGIAGVLLLCAHAVYQLMATNCEPTNDFCFSISWWAHIRLLTGCTVEVWTHEQIDEHDRI